MLSSAARFVRPAVLALVLVSCASERAVAPSPAPLAAPTQFAGSTPTHVVINEIMADPNAVTDANGEWFELYNPTASAVDLNGWKVVSANDATPYVFSSSLVIPAGGYLACVRNPDATANGGITTACSYGNGTKTINLNNSNTDYLAIKDAGGVTVDSVFWGGTTPPTGASRAVIDASLDHSTMDGPTATNWVTSSSTYGAGDRGTPGAANDGGSPPPQGGPVASVTVSPSLPSIVVAATQKFTATAKDSNGVVVSSSYTWTSSDTTVATIDVTGNATALRVGSTMVTATSANKVAGTTTLTVTSGTSTAVYRNNVEFGTPTDADASDDYIISRPQYTLSYNRNRNDPNWVSWNLNASQFGGSGRCDCFSADPALPPDYYHVVTSDYTGSGYDRGHMTPSDERSASAADNMVTFYMTNMLPQYHNLNAGPWEDLELYSKTLVTTQNKELYIISGGIFPASPQTLNNAGKVQIPTSTWKIIVVLNAGQGLADVHSTRDLQVIAVNMPDSLTVPMSAPWQNYTTTVDAIEAATGYNFLSALPDSIQKIVESNDHPPVTTLTPQGATTVALGQPISVTGKFTDPDGRGDAPWSYVFDWGDGTITKGIQLSYPSNLTQFTRSKTYSAAGTYVVRFTVTDKYGAGSYTEVPVTVQP